MTEVMTLPQNRDAEQGVLGSLLISDRTLACDEAFKILKPESFYLYAHQKIFEQLAWLYNNNQPIDIITLDDRLTSLDLIDHVGGFAYLADLSKNTPSSANILSYAGIVRDCAIKRFAIEKCNECKSLLFKNKDKSAEQIVDSISNTFSQIGDYAKAGKTGGLVTANEISLEWLQDQQDRAENPDAVKGLGSGIVALDDLLSPKQFIKGSLLVVGARPKVGKTTFYVQLALHCIRVEKKRAILFSLEMGRKQIFERMIGQVAGINTNVFYKTNQAFQDDELFAKASMAIQEITKDDLLRIDDTPAVSMAHIRSECRKAQREYGEIGLIAVDYLTLMTAEQAERNDLAYGKIVKDLKNLAREMNCIVLLLTQLNRGAEGRSDKRPLPSDSRDTGQIEQECDYWIGLHRESMFKENADPFLTEIIVRSNRHGETGTVYVDYKYGSIIQIDQEEAKRRAEKAKARPTRSKAEF